MLLIMTHMMKGTNAQKVKQDIQNSLQSAAQGQYGASSVTNSMTGTNPAQVRSDIQNSLGQQANQAFTNLGGTSSVSAASSLSGGALTSGTNPQEVRNQIQQAMGNQAGMNLGSASFGGGTQANKVRQEIRTDLSQQ
jgi:hypothetical protein